MLIPTVYSTASFAAVFVTLVGVLILWSNPQRAVNRTVFTCSLNWAAWLTCLHVSIYMSGGIFWVRMTCAVGAFLPMHLWVVNETIAGNWRLAATRYRWLPAWIVISVLMALVSFTVFFIPFGSSGPEQALAAANLHLGLPSEVFSPVTGLQGRARGWGYYGYLVMDAFLYLSVLGFTFANLKKLSGARRLELSIWLIGGCAVTLAILTTMVVSTATSHSVVPRIIQPLFVLAFYGGTAYTITAYRIFDAYQILRICLSKLVLVLVAGTAGYVVFALSRAFLATPLAILLTISVALVCADLLKGWLDRRFEFYSQDIAARQAAYLVAHNETRVENMETAFLEILRGWGRTDQAMIITGTSGKEAAGDEEATMDERVANALRQFKWVTPERLTRERTSRHHELLGKFLAERRLGAAVFSETPMLNVIVGVGVPVSRRAFTYPQITQLLELSTIIESALERTLMVMKIQHSEQLATVGLLGASLAHEIRNPLVSVKAIVQLLPSRYQEAEFRDKFFRLISDEVVRIDRLTEQLLDLASPHVYTARPVQLHSLLKSSLELVGPRAADKRVQIVTEFEAAPDSVFTDPAAVTQALLNLCFNAIQALEARPSDRLVKVITRNVPEGIELAVADNGPGITPEMRIRLFKPFQTSKSSGFGLGLTVCRDILMSLGARISIDKSHPGAGATFRITFPCPR